jgi:hypothetical protein
VNGTPPEQPQRQTRRSDRLQSAPTKASAKKIGTDGRSRPVANVAKPKGDPIVQRDDTTSVVESEDISANKSFECLSDVYLADSYNCPATLERLKLQERTA